MVQPVRKLALVDGNQDLVRRPHEDVLLNGLEGVVPDGHLTVHGRTRVQRQLVQQAVQRRLRALDRDVVLGVDEMELGARWVRGKQPERGGRLLHSRAHRREQLGAGRQPVGDDEDPCSHGRLL